MQRKQSLFLLPFLSAMFAISANAQVCQYQIIDINSDPVTGLDFYGAQFLGTIDPNFNQPEEYSGYSATETSPGFYVINIPTIDWNTAEAFSFSASAVNYGCMSSVIHIDTTLGCSGTILLNENPAPVPVSTPCKTTGTSTTITGSSVSGVSTPFPPNAPAPGASAAQKQKDLDKIANAMQSILKFISAASSSGMFDGKGLCTGSCPSGQTCRPTELEVKSTANATCEYVEGMFSSGGPAYGRIRVTTDPENPGGCKVKALQCNCITDGAVKF